MAKIGNWSTTAANNNSTPPDGWPEGQAPSTVNDCAREMMAQIRTAFNDLQYVDLGNTPNFLSTTTFSLSAADTTNFHVGRRLKLFDATTLYGTINSVSATFVSVRLDSGVLSNSLSSVALAIAQENNPSLPNHVYKQRNLIINGAMDIWQRGASFQIANNTTTYTADRWALNMSSGGALAVTRSERSANAANVPTVAQSGVLFNNALLVSVSAVDAAVAAGEFALIQYKVEGYDWRQIAQKPCVIDFWVNTNKSGIYALAVRNSGADRSFVQNFTISTVSTWTNFTIAIPESPTAGTWDYSTGAGLIVTFALEAGSTYQGGAGNWTAANVFATASQVNFLSSAGNVFALTGVQLKEGQGKTLYELRPFQTELDMAQRYYEKSFPFTTTPAQNAGTTGATVLPAIIAGASGQRFPTIRYQVQKRATASLTSFNPSAANAQIRNNGVASDFTGTTIGTFTNETGFTVEGTAPIGTNVDDTCLVHWTADAEL